MSRATFGLFLASLGSTGSCFTKQYYRINTERRNRRYEKRPCHEEMYWGPSYQRSYDRFYRTIVVRRSYDFGGVLSNVADFHNRTIILRSCIFSAIAEKQSQIKQNGRLTTCKRAPPTKITLFSATNG